MNSQFIKNLIERLKKINKVQGCIRNVYKFRDPKNILKYVLNITFGYILKIKVLQTFILPAKKIQYDITIIYLS